MVNPLTGVEYKDNSIFKSSENKAFFQRVNLNGRLKKPPDCEEFSFWKMDKMHIVTWVLYYIIGSYCSAKWHVSSHAVTELWLESIFPDIIYSDVSENQCFQMTYILEGFIVHFFVCLFLQSVTHVPLVLMKSIWHSVE